MSWFSILLSCFNLPWYSQEYSQFTTSRFSNGQKWLTLNGCFHFHFETNVNLRCLKNNNHRMLDMLLMVIAVISDNFDSRKIPFFCKGTMVRHIYSPTQRRSKTKYVPTLTLLVNCFVLSCRTNKISDTKIKSLTIIYLLLYTNEKSVISEHFKNDLEMDNTNVKEEIFEKMAWISH